jgi:hypothetical protein
MAHPNHYNHSAIIPSSAGRFGEFLGARTIQNSHKNFEPFNVMFLTQILIQFAKLVQLQFVLNRFNFF